jgi:hypothetical protein
MISLPGCDIEVPVSSITVKTSILLASILAMAACSSSSTPKPDAPPAATLTVKNYLSWCTINVNGGAGSSAASVTQPITGAATITLAATANTGFELGSAPWHDTAGDHGTGDPGTLTGTGQTAVSTTTVAVTTTNKCVWACCPFPDGTGCPTTDQCP